jgi:hypothetical protein
MSWTWVRGSDDAGTGLEQPVTDADNRASSPAAINAAFTGLCGGVGSMALSVRFRG